MKNTPKKLRRWLTFLILITLLVTNLIGLWSFTSLKYITHTSANVNNFRYDMFQTLPDNWPFKDITQIAPQHDTITATLIDKTTLYPKSQSIMSPNGLAIYKTNKPVQIGNQKNVTILKVTYDTHADPYLTIGQFDEFYFKPDGQYLCKKSQLHTSELYFFSPDTTKNWKPANYASFNDYFTNHLHQPLQETLNTDIKKHHPKSIQVKASLQEYTNRPNDRTAATATFKFDKAISFDNYKNIPGAIFYFNPDLKPNLKINQSVTLYFTPLAEFITSDFKLINLSKIPQPFSP